MKDLYPERDYRASTRILLFVSGEGHEVSFDTLIAARTLIAGALRVGALRLRGLRMPADRQAWRRFLFQACLNSVAPFTLIAWAERTVDAGLATILNSTSPILTFLLTAAVTRHEPVTGRKLLGVVAGLADWKRRATDRLPK